MIQADLRRHVRGEVLLAPRALARHSQDFGRIVRKLPQAVVRPAGEEDVATCFAIAAEHGVPVTLQGRGHSCNGQSLSEGGILLAGSDAPPSVGWLPEGLVEICGRSRWSAVERALNRQRRAVPVLADYLHLSVGGTLSVGGYGMDSITEGAQVDGVRRLRVIKPEGEAVWCSPTESPDLFRQTLCGLGRVGLIERVVMETRPNQRLTTFQRFEHEDLAALVDSLAWMEGWSGPWPDLFKAFCARGKTVSVYGFRGTATDRLPLPTRPRQWIWPDYRWWRSRSVALWVASFPNHYRLWFDYLFDYPGLKQFVQFLTLFLKDGSFAKALTSIYILAIRRPPSAFRFPLEAGGEPGGGPRFGIGLYCMIPRRNPEFLQVADEASQICLRECLALGGRPYLYGWHRLSEEARRDLYGGAFRLDADKILSLR